METITTASFAEHVEDLLSTWHVPGLSIAVFNSQTVTARGFGLASLDPEIPATPNTIIDVASTSKSFTAAAVAKLIAANKFTWSTTVSSLLLEAFVLPDNHATADVTVEDILSHRSGVAGHDFSYMGIYATTPDSARSVTTNMRNLPLSASLRTKFQYSNMLFTAAAYLVEQVSGQPFHQFLQANFFTPLGMTSTYVQASAVQAASPDAAQRFAHSYYWHKTDQKFVMIPWRDQPEAIGAGSIQSTVMDYAQWLRAMMAKSPLLFSEEIYNDLVTPRIVENPGSEEELVPFTSFTMYALGWEVEFYRGVRIITHGGSDLGYGCTMLFIPQVQFGIVIHGNAGDLYNVAQILTMELIDEVLNVPATERVDWAARQRDKATEQEKKESDELAKLRGELLAREPDEEAAAPSLAAYTGTYTNVGYHSMQVSIKDGNLFIDAQDRGMPFNLTFEPLRAGRFSIASMERDDGEVTHRRAEFDLDERGMPVRMGLDLEDELAPELIWFTKTSSS
ncbi:hypothetical protein H2200_002524 [Cladophialophora chaetospira]|uniref:Beta-lactamase/transpeptidase-like protein n=1 Tax=Cladophialophora chaetospira TaxID=386627 RepID=A0AA38XJU8_9EURO|nr:hypothetical protein H2200_002524 [Cladophialophora chaetospira]